MSHEHRALVFAAICALLAGALTFAYTGRAGQRAGASVPILVSEAPIDAGAVFDDRAAGATLVREIPAALAPPDALTDAVDLVGARARIDLPAGTLLTTSLISTADGDGEFKLRSGERAVEVDALVEAGTGGLDPGARVDLYASGFGGDQKTIQLIAAAEVLATSGDQGARSQRLTLRLADAQVASIVRGDVFARELRAVSVPTGER